MTSVFNSVAGLLGFLILAWVEPQRLAGQTGGAGEPAGRELVHVASFVNRATCPATTTLRVAPRAGSSGSTPGSRDR
ncbi:hypothetical protein Ae406Ps2_5589c [Pseudonocardia sp. Ae406_Ps2]|nr:hypothetical protein Ae331Ps2_0370 [Pseudonocardia sp. Ae331_Ps2]OLM05589.1 hypothetical protein Ae406Ps2_5589c [Pseudonocardia sp. Ae406_Ps2]OLM15462.1 hypothetical protein Ae505Ps2_5594 [Pseudonocardia sp. Ae505_Ps2]OLM27164.1 hypothetical protein Ae706Ps2_5598c [Pseudonocardia sp. Ae706_Ps2]